MKFSMARRYEYSVNQYMHKYQTENSRLDSSSEEKDWFTVDKPNESSVSHYFRQTQKRTDVPTRVRILTHR